MLDEGLHRFDTGCLHFIFGPLLNVTMEHTVAGWLLMTYYG